jgi:hypothetical protein
VVDGRYEVFATHGRGVFSSVLRARDRVRKDASGNVEEVAIKIIRANETMYKAGQVRRRLLLCLGGASNSLVSTSLSLRKEHENEFVPRFQAVLEEDSWAPCNALPCLGLPSSLSPDP